MKLTPVKLEPGSFPDEIARYLRDAEVYDSSCSERAATYYIDRDGGYFLKTAPYGSLATEAEMGAYFHRKGLSAKVWQYISRPEGDYMITQRVPGQDSITPRLLEQPARLCDALSESLARLHSVDYSDCPRMGVSRAIFGEADRNYTGGGIDPWQLEYVGIRTPQQGREFMLSNQNLLREDVLLHGDSCLPNILLDDQYGFQGFIDLGDAGVGDRHFDIFWTIWSLQHNLKTNDYMHRFIDGYGRDKFDMDRYILNGILAAFAY